VRSQDPWRDTLAALALFISGVVSGILIFVVLDTVFSAPWWRVFDFLPDRVWWWLYTLGS
jgi:F0F1-type ATP synthase assembly protein I